MKRASLYRWNGEYVNHIEFAEDTNEMEAILSLYHKYMGDPNRHLKIEFREEKPGVYVSTGINTFRVRITKS